LILAGFPMAGKAVVVVGPTPKDANTGLSVAVRCLIDGLEERGIPYSVADTTRWGVPDQPGRMSLRRALESFMTVLEALAKTLRGRNVYLTLSTSRGGFLRNAALIAWAAVLRRRIVVHLHGGGFAEFFEAAGPRFQSFILKTMERVTCIVALGERLVDQFSMIPAYREKVVIIPNGFPANMEVPPGRLRRIEPGEPLRILYLSNLVPSKGILFLIEAVKVLREQGNLIRLDIAGSLKDAGSSGEESYRQFVDQFESACGRLSDTCAYHGTVFGEQKQRLFEQAHIFCLPTYYPWEGQPISIIEALAYGLPVISTPHKGIPEQVIDGRNGFLVEPRSSEAIADALLRLLEDPDRCARFSREARRHFEENFTREVHQERLINSILGDNERE